MQQSHNFEQLQRLVADKGAKLWDLAFTGHQLAGFTSRRFQIRDKYKAEFLKYWVRCPVRQVKAIAAIVALQRVQHETSSVVLCGH